MNINEMLSESLFFGMILSLLAYKIGFEIQKKYKKEFLPLLTTMLIPINKLGQDLLTQMLKIY